MSVVGVIFAILLMAISIHSDDRRVKEERQVIGKILRYFSGQNRVWARLDKDYKKWLGKKIYMENLSSKIVSRFRIYPLKTKVDIQRQLNRQGSIKNNNTDEGIYLSGIIEPLEIHNNSGKGVYVQREIPVRMGYTLVVKSKIFQWIDEPKRKGGPFVLRDVEKPLPQNIRLEKDQREMALVPRGDFVIGSNTGSENEHPQRVIYLDQYYIDRYEVSNQDYYKYLVAMLQNGKGIWRRNGPEGEERDLAFSRASFTMAMDYCKWAGKDLPTEEQWEKAARGTGLRRVKDHQGIIHFYKVPINFPWGNNFDSQKVNGENKLGIILAVNAMKDGKSPFGLFHISGNVMEWTRSWYQAYPKSYAWDRDFGKIFKVLRGGDYTSSRWDLRVSRRIPGGIPSLSLDKRGGIRCVYNVKPTPQDGP